MAKNIVLRSKLEGAGKTRRGLKGVDSGLKSLAKSAMAAGAAYFTARGLISGFKTAIEAAGKQEQAEKKLATALGHTSRALLNQASAFQKVSQFGDETLIEMMALASNMGIAEDQIASTTEMAIGLSEAFSLDLNMSMKAAAAAVQGDTMMLSRYIPAIKGVKDESEKLAIVQRGAAAGFEQSRANTETMTGSLNQMKMAVGDAAEKIGDLLAPTVIKVANHLKTAAEKAQEFFNAFRADEIALQAAEIKGLNQAIEGTEKQVDRLRTAQKDIFLFSDQSSQMAVSRMKSVIILMQELLSPDQLKTFFGKGKEEQIKILEEIVAAHIEAAQEMKDEIDVITGGVPPGGITEDDIDDQKKKQKEIINMAGLMGKALGTAFDPDLGAGEAFKGFVIQLMSAMQGVILASKAVSEALTFTFTGPLGIATAITALVALEAAKAGVRSLEFAQGGDFVTSGPQMIMVGDNPGGKERVQVTPLSSPNIEGPQGGNIHLHFGAVTNEDYVKDFIVPEIQKAQRLNLA